MATKIVFEISSARPYDKLAKWLRIEADCPVNCPEGSRLMREAADAIEELSKKYLASDEEHAKHRWIPVTERLPEAESGGTSKPVLVTDGVCISIAEWFNFELCEPYWSYTGIGDVTHWQPLPEPPRPGARPGSTREEGHA